MKHLKQYRKHLFVGSTLLLIWVGGFLLRANLSFVQKGTTTPNEQITITDAEEPYDFSNLFLLTTKQEQSLICAVVEEQSVEEDLIEYYQTDFTTYTKYTLRVTQNLTEQFSSNEITVYRLGDAAAFPNRENLVNGKEYVMRVEPFVHGEEIIYLLSPLESTYMRVEDEQILSHPTAKSKEYTRISSLDDFKKAFDEYTKSQKYIPAVQGFVEEFRSIVSALTEYNYDNKNLDYTPSPAFRKSTLQTAQTILSKLEDIASDLSKGALTEQAALQAAKSCLS